MGWVRRFSEEYAGFERRTYTKGAVLESLRRPVKTEQELEFKAHQLLNEAMNHIALTSQYAGDIEKPPTDV